MKIFETITTSVARHKKISIFIGIILSIGIIFGIKSLNTSSIPSKTYVLGKVTQGTIVATVSGTGQVSTASTLALAPQVSGTLASIKVNPGDFVKKGQVLFTIDATNARTALRDAKIALASAQLAQKSFQLTTDSSQKTQSINVANAYTALLNSSPIAVASDATTAGYTPPIIDGNYTLGKEGVITITTYTSVGGVSFNATGLVTAAGQVTTTTSQPIGDSGLTITFPTKISPGLTWTISLPNKGASNYTSNYNNYQQAIKTETEAATLNGVTDIDSQTKALAIAQAQNTVDDAETTLAKYFITAPFDGTLATIPVVAGQQVSTGTSLGTLITQQQIATISLNEVDASKVSVGQKVTMTFDAIDGLNLTGKVAQIDTLGTVTQGVVSYATKIIFDTNDVRIKSGMSVSAIIATNVAQDILMVPSSAIKGSSDGQYVLTATSATDPSPVSIPITTGISDDMNTQIISGLTQDEQIVVKITTPVVGTPTTTAPSILNSIGGATRGGGAGMMRASQGR